MMPTPGAGLTRPLHQTTKDKCRLFHLGLDARDVLVIESLLRSNPELGGRYVFGPPDAHDTVDMVFVNGDDAAALAAWDTLQRQRPEVVAVMVASAPAAFPALPCLTRPLNFRNFLAILDTITATAAGPGPDAAAAGRDALRVLVVDDSFPARQYMKLKLEEIAVAVGLKLHIDLADSGERALEMAQQARYDLAFLDVVMPGIDGYEVCRRLKPLHAMRVAMLTGRTASVDFTRGRSAGCDNYLPKPANDADLRTILQLTALKKRTASARPG